MVSYEHKKIAGTVLQIDQPPVELTDFTNWIKADQHLKLLERNAAASERIIYASGPYTFIHTIAVPLKKLEVEDRAKLLDWNANPYTTIASYVSGRRRTWVERKKDNRGSTALDAGTNLIFGRTFEGWAGPERDYFEVTQEYAHLSDIHWRPERSAYCRYDRNGDLVDIVSVTPRTNESKVALVTFSWPELEEYLAISNYALVRMFDFTLLRYGQFRRWGYDPETIVRLSHDFFFRQKIISNAAYTRGVQIIRPRDYRTVGESLSRRLSGYTAPKHVTFIAQDWRHENAVVEISTDRAATTNYFDAPGNDLPYELSPVFFRPGGTLKI